jgi:hypothetical protein
MVIRFNGLGLSIEKMGYQFKMGQFYYQVCRGDLSRPYKLSSLKLIAKISQRYNFLLLL